MDRKLKEEEFFKHHYKTFSKLKLHNPVFAIKTSFFKKGKQGKFVQFFESELNKNENIYLEFFEYTPDKKDMEPAHENRQLFMLRGNPFYKEEYEREVKKNSSGGEYNAYLVPLSELLVIDSKGKSKTYSEFEEEESTTEQQKVVPFEDFKNMIEDRVPSIADLSVKDLCAIMWRKPIADNDWLNRFINQKSS